MESGELFYIGLEHIEKETGKILPNAIVVPIKTVKNQFTKGNILYGKLRPYLNKVHLAQRDGVCSTDILVFEVKKSIDPNFILNYILSREFVNTMSANTNGVNLPRVPTKFIQNHKISLPPLPEQRAIVAKIEQLFSELENGTANLNTAQEQLKVYRQAVLKKAFEGELTKEWRKENVVESSFITLSKISEKRRLEKKKKPNSLEKKLGHDFQFSKSDEVPTWAKATLNKLIYIAARIGWRGLKKEEYTDSGPFFLSVHSSYN